MSTPLAPASKAPAAGALTPSASSAVASAAITTRRTSPAGSPPPEVMEARYPLRRPPKTEGRSEPQRRGDPADRPELGAVVQREHLGRLRDRGANCLLDDV